MRTDRLLKLANHLDTVPPEKFDLHTWKNSCKTTACAIGHACDIFREEGLKLSRGVVFEDDDYLPGYYPEYEGSAGWFAVDAFFEMYNTYYNNSIIELHDYLFAESEYPDNASPQDVAARIRNYLSQTVTA